MSPGAIQETQESPPRRAAYLRLHESGELKERGKLLWEIMESCRLCPRECGANRLEGETGVCQSTDRLVVSSHHPHFGEERFLVGTGGSGTIFLSGCHLRCVFCQNWEISHEGQGNECSVEELAGMMLRLQILGCHNINLVSPTHFAAHILQALSLAAEQGLHLPVVYNTCGWERLEILRLLDGVVDIYLPDFKFSQDSYAESFCSGARKYVSTTQAALTEMHRQVGTAILSADGLVHRGLVIRHLVMPEDGSGTREVLNWIASHLPRDTRVNLMSQYHPAYGAFRCRSIARRLNRGEYAQAVRWALESGLTAVHYQE